MFNDLNNTITLSSLCWNQEIKWLLL